MNPTEAAPHEFRYDAFISYSRKDREFAGRLERALRSYRPPKDLAVPQRYLRVFRDEDDFTGSEYHDSLDRSLRDAAKLIVICSPNSASSRYVSDEIRRFSEQRGKDHIIPILLDGIPNNEVKDSNRAQSAFPEELVRLLPIPLAADYRGVSPQADNIRKGTFAPAWFKTLADLYADHGIDRAAIEQRERRREMRRLRTIVAISSSVALALIALTIWALLSRNEATRQRDNSEARRYETEARLAFGSSADALAKATLFSVASVHFARTVDGQLALGRFLSLLPRPPLWRQQLAERAEGIGGGRRRVLAFSPDGARVASAGRGGVVQLLDARTGQVVGSIDLERNPADRTVATFSPDGRFLVLGCGHVACVVDVAAGRMVTRLPPDRPSHGTMAWAAAFSPDGQRLAMSAYGSGDVFIYEVPTWRTVATLRAGSGTVFSVAFSPDGQWLATAGPQELQLWRSGQYAAPAGQVSTPGTVWSIAFQPDGEGLVTASRGVQAWRIVPGKAGAVQLERGAGHAIEAHTVLSMAWHGRTCVAAAAPDAIHLLCGDSLDEVVTLPVSSAAAALSFDRRSFLNEQSDGTLAAWSLDAGLEDFRVAIDAPVRSIATADRGGWLAAGTDTGRVVVVGLDTWRERTRLQFPSPVTQVNASGDGRWLVVAEASSVHVYDAANWREASSTTYADKVAWAGFDSSQRSLVVVAGMTLVVLEPAVWRERLRVDHDARVTAVRVSPDGGRLATVTHFTTGGHDAGVLLTRVFDIASTTESAWEYNAPGGGNITRPFMEAEAARKKRTLTGGNTTEVSAAASWPALELTEPDDRVSGDNSWSIRVSGSIVELIDVAAGRTVAELDHLGEVTAARFVPTSAPRWVVSAGEDGTLATWPVRAAELAEQACVRLRAMIGPEGMGKLISEGHIERSCDTSPRAPNPSR